MTPIPIACPLKRVLIYPYSCTELHEVKERLTVTKPDAPSSARGSRFDLGNSVLSNDLGLEPKFINNFSNFSGSEAL
jgi:hypothetical protein